MKATKSLETNHGKLTDCFWYDQSMTSASSANTEQLPRYGIQVINSIFLHCILYTYIYQISFEYLYQIISIGFQHVQIWDIFTYLPYRFWTISSVRSMVSVGLGHARQPRMCRPHRYSAWGHGDLPLQVAGGNLEKTLRMESYNLEEATTSWLSQKCRKFTKFRAIQAQSTHPDKELDRIWTIHLNLQLRLRKSLITQHHNILPFCCIVFRALIALHYAGPSMPGIPASQSRNCIAMASKVLSYCNSNKHIFVRWQCNSRRFKRN